MSSPLRIGPPPAPGGEMPFLDHLEELRRRILIGLAAAVLGSVVGVVLAVKADVIGVLLHPLSEALADLAAAGDVVPAGMLPESGRLHFLSLTEPFFFVLKIGVGTGLLLVAPVIVYQAWAFLSPALEPRERRVIIPSLYFGLLLFVAGGTLAYFVALPMSIRFLLRFGSDHFTPVLTAGHYLSFVVSVLLAFGILFELPIVILILSALGVVTPRFLRDKRRHAYVLLLVLACMVTPGDLFAMTGMLIVPLLVLYEVSIVLAALLHRGGDSVPGSGGIADAAAVSLLMGIRLRRAGGPRLVGAWRGEV